MIINNKYYIFFFICIVIYIYLLWNLNWNTYYCEKKKEMEIEIKKLDNSVLKINGTLCNINNRIKPKIKGVIVYLGPRKTVEMPGRGISRFEVMIRSIENLDYYFNNKFNYPIIIFHEDYNMNEMEMIQNRTNSSKYSFIEMIKIS